MASVRISASSMGLLSGPSCSSPTHGCIWPAAAADFSDCFLYIPAQVKPFDANHIDLVHLVQYAMGKQWLNESTHEVTDAI